MRVTPHNPLSPSVLLLLQPQQLPTVARSSGEAKVAMNAGFGQGKAKKLKETPPSFTSGEALARAALKEYKRLRRDGGTVAQVHARVKGSEEWYPVGNVRHIAVGGGWPRCNTRRCMESKRVSRTKRLCMTFTWIAP